MGPIEALWIAVVVMFVFIGIARGYDKELGSTIVILVVLLLFSLFGDSLESLLESLFGRFTSEQTTNLLTMLVFQGIFIVITVAGYAGVTLQYPGTPPAGCSGITLNAFFGGLNGILVAGTLWYYLAYFEYPLEFIDTEQLSQFAKDVQNFLPPTWPSSVLFVWLALLIILRVRR